MVKERIMGREGNAIITELLGRENYDQVERRDGKVGGKNERKKGKQVSVEVLDHLRPFRHTRYIPLWGGSEYESDSIHTRKRGKKGGNINIMYNKKIIKLISVVAWEQVGERGRDGRIMFSALNKFPKWLPHWDTFSRCRLTTWCSTNTESDSQEARLTFDIAWNLEKVRNLIIIIIYLLNGIRGRQNLE